MDKTLEILCKPEEADKITGLAKKYGVAATVSEKMYLVPNEQFEFSLMKTIKLSHLNDEFIQLMKGE